MVGASRLWPRDRCRRRRRPPAGPQSARPRQVALCASGRRNRRRTREPGSSELHYCREGSCPIRTLIDLTKKTSIPASSSRGASPRAEQEPLDAGKNPRRALAVQLLGEEVATPAAADRRRGSDLLVVDELERRPRVVVQLHGRASAREAVRDAERVEIAANLLEVVVTGVAERGADLGCRGRGGPAAPWSFFVSNTRRGGRGALVASVIVLRLRSSGSSQPSSRSR